MPKVITLLLLFLLGGSLFLSGCKTGPSPAAPTPAETIYHETISSRQQSELERRQEITSIVQGAVLPAANSLPSSPSREVIISGATSIVNIADAVAPATNIEFWQNYLQMMINNREMEARTALQERAVQNSALVSRIKEADKKIQELTEQVRLERERMHREFLEEKEKEIAAIRQEYEDSTRQKIINACIAIGLICMLGGAAIIFISKGQALTQGGGAALTGLGFLGLARIVGHPYFLIASGIVALLAVVSLGILFYYQWKQNRKVRYTITSLQDLKNEAQSLAEKGDQSATNAWNILKTHLEYNEKKYYPGISKEIDKDLNNMEIK